jgi:segregation and condensation protein B
VAQNSDGYRMTLRQPFHPLREKFFGRTREARLSQAAIDVLAIIAYQQPLTAEQISTVRSKPSGHVLSQLVHRGLLRIERVPGKRKVVQYFTTDRFLKLFGLQTLADLPQSEELDRQ